MLLPAMLESHLGPVTILVASLPTQLSANTPKKVAKDVPCVWDPATHRGDLKEALGSWPQLGLAMAVTST